MAAPKFLPVDPTDAPRTYDSPDVVPSSWRRDRPSDIEGPQPTGERLGAQGPDQGYALKLARVLQPDLHVADGENEDDVIRGCLGVALRRASMHSRAPVIHDLRIAFTVWGFLDPEPDAELVELRSTRFEGLRHVGHHYAEAREVVDLVDVDVLRLGPDQVTERYRAGWRDLLLLD